MIDKQHRLNSLLGIKSPSVVAVNSQTEVVQYSEEGVDEEQVYEAQEEIIENEICHTKIDKIGSEADYQEAPSEIEMIEEEDEEVATSETEEIGENYEDEEMDSAMHQLEDAYQLEENSTSYQVCYEEEEYVEYGGEISMMDVPPKRKYTKHTKDSLKPYKCWVKGCGTTFAFRTTMKKHMNINHKILCQKSTCFICGSNYDDYADFLAHVKIHTRKSQCEICKLTFINDEKLESHRAKVHKGGDEGRNFECKVRSLSLHLFMIAY